MKLELFEYLSKLGREKSTGCLQLRKAKVKDSEERTINVYLLDGQLCYCESRSLYNTGIGLHYLAKALKCEGLEAWWIDGRQPPRILFKRTVEQWLEQLEMLEFHRLEEVTQLIDALSFESGSVSAGVMDPSACAVSLIAHTPELKPREFFMYQSEMVIGSSPSSDLVLNQPFISASHCRLRVHRGQIQLEDLDSAHGVRVNDIRVRRTRLMPGDRLQLGNLIFEFSVRSWTEVSEPKAEAGDVAGFCQLEESLQSGQAEVAANDEDMQIFPSRATLAAISDRMRTSSSN